MMELNTSYFLADSTKENGFVELTKENYLNIFINNENPPYAIQAYRGKVNLEESTINYEIGEFAFDDEEELYKILIVHHQIEQNLPLEIIIELFDKISLI